MSSIFEFDFDEWAALARRDPEAFERRRDHVVNEIRARMSVRSVPAIDVTYWHSGIERPCFSTFRRRREHF